jgi:hypothetical protein
LMTKSKDRASCFRSTIFFGTISPPSDLNRPNRCGIIFVHSHVNVTYSHPCLHQCAAKRKIKEAWVRLKWRVALHLLSLKGPVVSIWTEFLYIATIPLIARMVSNFF